MFGYIVVHKPELKGREYESYRASYCGLCHSLKNQSGRIGQLTLSFDMTFLALLLVPPQKREREEAAKREALAKKEEQPQEPKKAPKPVTSAEPKTEMGKAIESIERHAYQQAVTGTIANPVTQQPGLSGGKKIWTIQVRGNEEQHKKILDYIKFVGAEYREV